MKILDTSAVTPASWVPLLGNYGGGGANSFATTGSTNSMAGIDFIQQAYTECLDAIARFAIADTTKVTVMYGCNQTFPLHMDESYAPGTIYYGVAPGWIYYNGELYYVQGIYVPITPIPPGSYINATILTAQSLADSVLFSDNTAQSVHTIRTISLSITTTQYETGSGDILPDYEFWKFNSNNSNASAPADAVIDHWTSTTWAAFSAAYYNIVSPVPIQVGTTGKPPFENFWANTGINGVANMLSYYKLFGRVYLWGEVTFSGTASGHSVIFHLPAGYRPASAEEVFAVPDVSDAHYPGAGGYDVHATYFVWIQNDGSVTFLGNSVTGQKISLSGINFISGSIDYTLPAAITT